MKTYKETQQGLLYSIYIFPLLNNLKLTAGLIVLLFSASCPFNEANAQATLPAISSLPFSFSSYSGTTFPSSLTIGKASGTSLSTADFTTDAANGGGGAQWRAEAANGISYQGGSGSTTPSGCFQIRVNSTAASGIQVSWRGRTITDNVAGITNMDLQWRNGGAGAWNTVSGFTFISLVNNQTFNATLPAGANNLADLRIRWICYDASYVNILNPPRDRVGVDDISICGTPAAVASNSGPVCPGNAVTLSAVPSGLSYQWTGPGGFSSALQNPTVSNLNGLTSGTYRVTVISGTCSATASTAVNDLGTMFPAPVSSPSAACPGNLVNLSVNSNLKYSNNTSFSIPDGGGNGVSSPVVVSGFSPAIVSSGTLLSVTFNISHIWTPDLEVHLVAPNGADINIVDNRGLGSDFVNTTIVNSGGADGNVSNAFNPFSGTYNSDAPFSGLNGSPANGTWNLKVIDGSGNFLTGSTLNWTLNLTADGVNFSWSSLPAGFSSTSQNTTDHPTVNTSYNVVAVKNGCSYSSVTPATVAMLTPQVNVSSNSPVCLGDSIRLFGNNGATGQSTGNTYSWSGPDGFISTEQNPVLLATNASGGIYTLSITNQFSCTAQSTYNVSINPLPQVAPTSNAPFCSGVQNLQLQANSPTGQVYAWSGPGAFNSSSPNPVLNNATDLQSGDYKVIVTDANGCRDSSISHVTIYSLPQVDLIVVGSNHICTNQTTSDLLASGAQTYLWNTSETTDLITVSTAGTYTVTGTDVHGCINTNQEVITESAPPAPPIVTPSGPIYLCSEDGGMTFSSTTLCVTNYSSNLVWSTNGVGACITVDFIDLFNVNYTDALGCTSMSNSVETIGRYGSVAPTSVSTDAPGNSLCPGPVTLTVDDGSLGDLADWVWYEGSCSGVSVGNGSSVTLTPSGSGTHTYFVRAEGYCNTTSCASVAVNVKSESVAPSSSIASPSVLCEGDQTVISISGGSLGSGANWLLYENGCGSGAPLQSSSSPDFNVVPQSPGLHNYFIRAEGDCNTTLCSQSSVDVKDSSSEAVVVLASAPVICEGNQTTLTINGGHLGRGAVWAWYENGCANGIALQRSASTSLNIVPQGSGLHTYFVRAEGDCNVTECMSVTVNVKSLSVAPASASALPANLCEGNSTVLSAAGGSLGSGANWVLYENGCGNGAALQSSLTPTFTITPQSSGSHNYFIRAEGDCNATLCSQVSIDVKDSSSQASSILASSNAICDGDQTMLTVTGGHLGRGAVWAWYENGCGNGNALQRSVSNSLNVSPQGTGQHTYFVRAEGDCNVSQCLSITITVKEFSSAPTSASAAPAVICQGNPTTLSVAGGYLGTGANWKWYSGTCGGTLAGVGASININPNVTTTYFVRAEGDCNVTNCVSTIVTARTISTDPSSVLSSAPVNGICLGSTVTLTVTGGSLGTNSAWVWYEDGCGNGTSIGTGSSITITPPFQGLHNYYVRAEGPCNISNCAATSVLVGSYSIEPVSVTTNVAGNSICSGSNITLTLNGGLLGTLAQWHWYSGSCGGTVVGSGTSITVNPTSTTTYFVRAEGSCNNSICKSATVNVSTAAPSNPPPTIISAPNGICNGNGSTVVCQTVTNATFYSWSAPNGTTFDGNNPSPYVTTVPTVNVTFGNLPNGVTGYDICVFAGNGCGNTVTKCRYIRGRVQSAQTISGNLNSCPNTSSTYSITSLPGADNYTWTITGAATINGGSSTYTGNSTSVTVNFLSNWTSGTLSVHGSMNCGYSAPDKTITIISTPVVPGNITGPVLVCPSSTYNYSIASVPGAFSYAWSSSVAGAVINGTGTSVSITFPSSIPAGATVSVSAIGSCGTSAPRIKNIATGLANSPGFISGPSTGQCGQVGVSYSILPVGGATGYLWSVNNGASISGPNNLSAVSINFPSSINSTTISVIAVNGCGNSAPQTKVVSGPPSQSGLITGSQAVCNGSIEQYSTAGASGATAYNWSVPADAIILNGQNSSPILVLWGATSGNVSVIASNDCGSAISRSLPVSVVCRQAQVAGSLLQASVYPNPTSGKTTLKFDAPTSGKYNFQLTDVTGRIIQSQDINATEGINLQDFDLTNVAKGLYLIRMESHGELMQLLKVTVE